MWMRVAALVAPPARARLLYEATTAVSAVRASIVRGDLQQCVSGLLKCAGSKCAVRIASPSNRGFALLALPLQTSGRTLTDAQIDLGLAVDHLKERDRRRAAHAR